MIPSRPARADLPQRLRAFAARVAHHPLYRALRGHGAPVHLVGGSVRDVLLDLPLRDHDFTTPRDAVDLARRAAAACGGTFVPLKAARGMARVVLGGEHVDVADYQAPSLQADLRGRDLTINALAIDLESIADGEPVLVDVCGGVDDLCAGRLRCPSPAVLDDDPLRLLRVARFACTLGFEVDRETVAALAPRGPLLAGVAVERVRDELFRILESARAYEGLMLLEASGLLGAVLPELAPMRGLAQGPFHHRDVFDHTLLAVRAVDGYAVPAACATLDDPGLLHAHLDAPVSDARPARALLKLGALMHDVGKPASRRVKENGRVSYGGHERVGAAMMNDFCARLKLSGAERARLTAMVAWHLEPLEMSARAPVRPRDIRRYFRDVHPAGIDTLLLALADSDASRGPRNTPQLRAALLDRVGAMLRWIFSDAPDRCVPLLDGRVMGELVGESPGPAIGQWLDGLADEQADGNVRTSDEAVAWVVSAVQAKRHEPS